MADKPNSIKLQHVRILKGYSLAFEGKPVVTELDNKDFILHRTGTVITATLRHLPKKKNKKAPLITVEFTTHICNFWIPDFIDPRLVKDE